MHSLNCILVFQKLAVNKLVFFWEIQLLVKDSF